MRRRDHGLPPARRQRRPAEAALLPTGPFRRFAAAFTISICGDYLTNVALLVLTYRLTGSVVAPAGYLLARQVPRLAGGLPMGALADRFTPQAVVAVASLGQAATVGGIVVLGDRGSAAGVYALVVAGQLGAGASRAATNAVVPRLVPVADLPRANAVLQLLVSISLIGALALAAPLLAWRGPDPLLLADAGSFLVAAVLVAALPTRYAGGVRGVRLGVFGVLRGVRAHPLLRTVAAAHLAEGIAVNVAASVFVVLAEARLGGDGAVAFLYVFVGVGDALGALAVLRARPPRVTPLAVGAPALVCVASVAVLAAATSMWSAALPLLACGASAVVFQTWGIAEAQRITDHEVMGRVTSVFYLSQAAGLTIGSAAQAVVLSVVRWDVAVVAIPCVTAVLLAAVVAGGRTGRARVPGIAAADAVPPAATA